MTDRMQTVQGRCPACGWTSLFLGDGGHVTCSRLECPNPTAADDLLHGEHVGAATPLVCSDERHAAKVADLERQLDQAREECRNWAEAESADIAAGSYAGRVQELEAAVARVRAYAADAIAAGDTGPGVHIGQLLLHLLAQPAPTTATQATDTQPLAVHSCGQEPHTRHCVTTLLPTSRSATATQATDTQERRMADADLLAWAVILELRRQQQRDGITLLLIPFPPCPTCRKNVHTVDLIWTDERLQHEQTLTMQPCGHRHVATLADIHRLYDRMADMLDQIRIDRDRPAGESPWTSHRIIGEAKARVRHPDV